MRSDNDVNDVEWRMDAIGVGASSVAVRSQPHSCRRAPPAGAGLAGERAARQDAFWEMHDALFALQGLLGGLAPVDTR